MYKVDSLNKKFIDMVVILKNLNEGENFNTPFIKDLFKFSKHIGFCYIHKTPQSSIGNKHSIGLIKNGKHKQYFFKYLTEGVMLLFTQKNSEVVNKFIYLKNPLIFIYKYDPANLILGIDSRQQKKNIIIFKNKDKYVKYYKHNSIFLKFENEEIMKEMIRNLYSGSGLKL